MENYEKRIGVYDENIASVKIDQRKNANIALAGTVMGTVSAGTSIISSLYGFNAAASLTSGAGWAYVAVASYGAIAVESSIRQMNVLQKNKARTERIAKWQKSRVAKSPKP